MCHNYSGLNWWRWPVMFPQAPFSALYWSFFFFIFSRPSILSHTVYPPCSQIHRRAGDGVKSLHKVLIKKSFSCSSVSWAPRGLPVLLQCWHQKHFSLNAAKSMLKAHQFFFFFFNHTTVKCLVVMSNKPLKTTFAVMWIRLFWFAEHVLKSMPLRLVYKRLKK